MSLRFSGLLISIIFFVTACTTKPISRRGSGYAKQSFKPRYNYRGKKGKKPIFSPIRKKIALLPLFNESPFGKQDLAITATEELRREISRTRDYVVDPEAAALFGSSKDKEPSGPVIFIDSLL